MAGGTRSPSALLNLISQRDQKWAAARLRFAIVLGEPDPPHACGACASSLELWAVALPHLRFIGADISEAVNVARDRFHEHGFDGLFIQSDLHRLPIARGSVDLIFSEGVLHHCDDTREALASVPMSLRTPSSWREGRVLSMFNSQKRAAAIAVVDRSADGDQCQDRPPFGIGPGRADVDGLLPIEPQGDDKLPALA